MRISGTTTAFIALSSFFSALAQENLPAYKNNPGNEFNAVINTEKGPKTVQIDCDDVLVVDDPKRPGKKTVTPRALYYAHINAQLPETVGSSMTRAQALSMAQDDNAKGVVGRSVAPIMEHLRKIHLIPLEDLYAPLRTCRAHLVAGAPLPK